MRKREKNNIAFFKSKRLSATDTLIKQQQLITSVTAGIFSFSFYGISFLEETNELKGGTS
jgi:hypothetical protein